MFCKRKTLLKAWKMYCHWSCFHETQNPMHHLISVWCHLFFPSVTNAFPSYRGSCCERPVIWHRIRYPSWKNRCCVLCALSLHFTCCSSFAIVVTIQFQSSELAPTRIWILAVACRCGDAPAGQSAAEFPSWKSFSLRSGNFACNAELSSLDACFSVEFSAGRFGSQRISRLYGILGFGRFGIWIAEICLHCQYLVWTQPATATPPKQSI